MPADAGAEPGPRGAVRLARILDDRQGVRRRELAETAHVGHLAVQVHGEQEAGATADRLLGSVDVEVVVGLADVDEDGARTGLRHGLERRDERVGGDDHLVPGSTSGREQREPQRIEAAARPDRMTRPAVRGELLLERLHLRSVRERAVVDQSGDITQDVLLHLRVDRGEIDERNLD